MNFAKQCFDRENLIAMSDFYIWCPFKSRPGISEFAQQSFSDLIYGSIFWSGWIAKQFSDFDILQLLQFEFGTGDFAQQVSDFDFWRPCQFEFAGGFAKEFFDFENLVAMSDFGIWGIKAWNKWICPKIFWLCYFAAITTGVWNRCLCPTDFGLWPFAAMSVRVWSGWICHRFLWLWILVAASDFDIWGPFQPKPGTSEFARRFSGFDIYEQFLVPVVCHAIFRLWNAAAIIIGAWNWWLCPTVFRPVAAIFGDWNGRLCLYPTVFLGVDIWPQPDFDRKCFHEQSVFAAWRLVTGARVPAATQCQCSLQYGNWKGSRAGKLK